jgi:hypothetical protein
MAKILNVAKKRKKPMAKKSKSVLKTKTTFSGMQIMLFVLAFAAVGAVAIWQSLAAPANGNGKKTSIPPLSLTKDYVQNTPNTSAPTDCLNEDDYHERDYYGSLSGSVSAVEQLCDNELSGGVAWGSGGIGLRAEAWVVGTLTDMTITSPTGVAHHAVLIDSATSKGTTTNHYQTCFVPPYSTSTDIGGSPLSMVYPGNPWTYNLSGNISKVDYRIYGQMTDVMVQQRWCPASEQNLVP